MNNENKSVNVFGKSSPVLFCLCSIVFIAIGMIVFRDCGEASWLCRSDWFWWRILWFEAIFAVFWFAIFGLPFSRLLQNRHMTGATYAIIATICLQASRVSFVIWCISSFIPTDTFVAILPVVIQLLVAMYYGVVVFMFPKTQALQTDGMEQPSQFGLPNPSELVMRLESLERRLGAGAGASTIKRLKENIRYSLPSVGRIAANDDYKALVANVVQMTDNPQADIAKPCQDMEILIRRIIESCKQ